jgi:paraquat-inducible protein B
MGKPGIFISISLVLATLALSGGCGGGDDALDRARAREFMQTGDNSMARVETDFQTISEIRAQAWDKATGEDARLNTEELNQMAEDMKSALQTVNSSLAQAEDAYQQINSLSDSKDYKEYAGVMLELIAEYEKSVLAQQSALQNGQIPDLISGDTLAGGDTSAGIDSLREKARAIKSERNL